MDAIRKGVISTETMIKATSAQRLEILSNVIGPENAHWVNAALETKILLKDQNRGMVSWAKNVANVSPKVRADMISMIQKNDRIFDPNTPNDFLASLASKKFGTDISFDEAKTVTDLAAQEKAAKAAVNPKDPIGSPSRLNYAAKAIAFQEYVDGLKLGAQKVPPSWYFKHPIESVFRSSGVAKSLLSTLDNSWFGRQGIKMLLSWKYKIWGKGFLKSWDDIGKELRGKDAMYPIKLDVYSRPNALNGKYKALGLDISMGAEEAFPSQVLTKIPVAGRVAKAAESAFNGAALRFRADLADKLIAKAERQGVDLNDPIQAQSIGKLVNAMTGRGYIGKAKVAAKNINATIFSLRFLKSNFDTLTAHQFQKGVTPFVRKEAAMNWLKMATSLAGIYAFANALHPGSVEIDPRSGRFGKIKIGDTTFDVTGGMGSLVTLAFRLLPTMHNGKMGFYTKNRAGEVVELGTGKYGQASPMDVLVDFWEGKLAPYTALIRDLWKGTDFQGRQTYVEGHRPIPNARTLAGAFVPIPAQNFVETMQNPNAAPLLATTILDGLGIGASTYTPKPSAKVLKQFNQSLSAGMPDYLRKPRDKNKLPGETP